MVYVKALKIIGGTHGNGQLQLPSLGRKIWSWPMDPFEKAGSREIPRNPSCYDVLLWAIILESNNIRLHRAASNKEEREFNRGIRVLTSSEQSVKAHSMIVYKIRVRFICTRIVHILLCVTLLYYSLFIVMRLIFIIFNELIVNNRKVVKTWAISHENN